MLPYKSPGRGLGEYISHLKEIIHAVTEETGLYKYHNQKQKVKNQNNKNSWLNREALSIKITKNVMAGLSLLYLLHNVSLMLNKEGGQTTYSLAAQYNNSY